MVPVLELHDDFELDDAAVDGARVTGARGRGGRIRFSSLRDVALGRADLGGITLGDIVAERVDFTATELARAHIRSARFSDCRCLGTGWAEASFTDVSFVRCTLEMSNMRFARLERVLFEGCDLTSVDFGGATLTDVVVKDCRLGQADFREARLSSVDLRTSSIDGLKGLASLRGATISVSQLVGIAPALAAEMGIEVQP